MVFYLVSTLKFCYNSLMNFKPDQFTNNEILRENFLKKIVPQLKEFIERKTLPREINLEADNLFEFRCLLGVLNIKEKEITSTLSHENAHANKAQSFENKGVKHFGYRLKITVLKNGECVFTPQARWGVPDEFRELRKEHKDILRAVYLAPLEYGDKLSPDDIEAINQL
jgi:hypothetical protein